MNYIFQKIMSFFSIVFGQWSWQPPQWLHFIVQKMSSTRMGRWCKAKKEQFVSFSKLYPKKAMLWAGGGFLLCVGLFAGTIAFMHYLDSLPKPDYVEISAIAPSPTDPDSKHVYSLSISFSKSAVKMDLINRDVSEFVKLTPEISGAWKWTDDKTLLFEPKAEAFKTDWLVGTEYQVKLDKKMFPSHLEFKSYKVDFKTPELSLSLVQPKFYIDPTQPKNKKAIITVWSNYPLSAEDFKKRLSVSYQSADSSTLGGIGSTLTPKVTFNPTLTQAYIETENLDIPAVDSVVQVTVDKGVQTLRGGEPSLEKKTEQIPVAGLYSAFKIDDLKVIFARNEKFEPEQVLVFNSGIEAKSEDIQKSLKVYLLPENHKPPGAKKIVKNYAWSSPSEVTENIKKESTEVPLELISTEQIYSADHSFKINVPVQRSLYIEIKKGIKALGDYELGTTYTHVLLVPDYTPELMFMSEGSILSLSGDRKLPLLARNIEKAKFKIGRVLPHQVNFMISKIFQGNNFKSPYLYDVKDMIMENFEEEQQLPIKSKTETLYFSLDMKPYIKDAKGFFFVDASAEGKGVETALAAPMDEEGAAEGQGESEGESDNPSDFEQGSSPYSVGTTQHLNDERLIMVTDLGLIAKQTAAGTTMVFVQNLRSGLPVENATIEIIGKNGLTLLSQVTDSNGKTAFPKLDNYKNEKSPLAIVAKKGEDFSYLPYQMNSRKLTFSRFDVGGEVENADTDQLSSLLFSDRGLYRPGDKVNIGIILRAKTTSANVNKLPLMMVVTDPRGTVFKREKFPVKTFSLQDFQFTTSESSPTGEYVVQLILIKKEKSYDREVTIGSTTVKVEEFVPDKLKISSQFLPFKSKGWIPLAKLQAKLSLKNLFGSAAENRNIKAEYSITPISPSVAKFKDYTFINPNSKDAQSVSESLANKVTDQKGEADYEIDLSKYQGYYLVRLKAEGFETEGGRSVDTAISVAASQLNHLVGFKSDGSLKYINKNSQRNIKFISINSDQEPAENSVKLVLNEIKYVSSLVKQSNLTYKYQSIKKEKEVSVQDLKIGKDGTSIKLPTDKAGQYVYIVKNDKGDEINRVEFNVIGEANLSRSLDRNAELQIALNKEDYQNGEEIELQIIAPYSGAGLITIERDTVYAQKWFKTSSNTTVEKIRVPEGLSGNAYINVTFLRDINSKEIYMSPLSFGVQPFTISLDKQRTTITLKSPEKVRPGEKLTVQYSASQPTSLILYGVDEGILQVARYKLPNPLLHFFRKRALAVDTYQLLDLLLPEFSLIKEMSSTGGDMEADSTGQNLNPFKAKGLAPVVFWSGVLSADQKTKTFTYDVPDYFNGNIKLMAVASSASGVGSTEGSSFSRGDFIITPTVPIFIAPSDEIHVGVNVSNQVENPKSSTDVSLGIETSSHLEVIGEKSQKLNIPQGREMGASFVLKASQTLGAADLKFSATNGTQQGSFKQQVSVRPAVPMITSVETGFAGTLPLSLSLRRRLMAEKGENKLSIAASPLAMSSGLISYLNDFPHGCTEQIVSQTVPSLALIGLKDAPAHLKKAKVAHDHLIEVLRTRQTPQGGFSLYGHDNTDAPAASLYVAQYLVDANDKGLETPDDMQANIVNYLKSTELRKVSSLSDVRLFAQAIYLQARYGIVPSNDLNFLMEALQKNFKDQWKTDGTAVYIAGIYQILQQEDKGWSLLKNLKMNQTTEIDYSAYYSPVLRDSLLINIIARHYPSHLKDVLTNESLQNLIKPILNQSLNTVESAQIIMAFSSLTHLAEKKGFPGSLQAQEIVTGQTKNLELPKKLLSELNLSIAAEKVSVSGDEQMLPLFYSLTQKGFDQNLPKKEIKNKIEVSRVFEDKKGKAITSVASGDEVTVIVRLRGLDKSYIPYIVIVDLFPAGFELQRDSVASNADYTDKREDRMVMYTHASADMQEFRYTLKATHKGKFTVPPIFAESMYDRSVQYVGVAQKFEVH